jgi:hypothetical protein
MDRNNNIAEEKTLKSILDSFVGSYIGRDKTVDFSSWLAGQIQHEMPDITVATSENLSRKIIEAVAEYDKTLNNLNQAIESGYSKEEWLADRVTEAYDGMPFEEAGNLLKETDNDWIAANALLMGETVDTSEVIESEFVEWNEYSVKSKALDIGRQAVMSGLGTVANIIKKNAESGEAAGMNELIGQILQTGAETAASEVKAVVAGAIKTAAENKLADFLPAGTPIEYICDIAGIAVESAEALFNVAAGKTTMTEALDVTGRASVTAACHWCAGALKAKLALIPFAGPLAVNLAGGLLDHMKSPKFTENVYTVVHDAAVATWNGIKEKKRGIFSKLKNTVTAFLNN